MKKWKEPVQKTSPDGNAAKPKNGEREPTRVLAEGIGSLLPTALLTALKEYHTKGNSRCMYSVHMYVHTQ